MDYIDAKMKIETALELTLNDRMKADADRADLDARREKNEKAIAEAITKADRKAYLKATNDRAELDRETAFLDATNIKRAEHISVDEYEQCALAIKAYLNSERVSMREAMEEPIEELKCVLEHFNGTRKDVANTAEQLAKLGKECGYANLGSVSHNDLERMSDAVRELERI